MKKRFFLLILLSIIILFGSKVYAFNVVKPTENFYVNDYANLLSEDTEKYIMEHSINLNNKTKSQIVVVTVNDLDGASIEDYSITLARNFKIGDKEKNNGLLIIVSKEDRKMRIEVGYGLEEVITDGKAGRIRDNYMIPFLKNDDYDQGILNGYKAAYKEIAEYYNLDEIIDEPIEEEINVVEVIFYIGIYALIMGLIIYYFSKHGGIGPGVGGFYYDGDSGSRSSSGSSFSGFSGGGGSFGGGGASGSF